MITLRPFWDMFVYMYYVFKVSILVTSICFSVWMSYKHRVVFRSNRFLGRDIIVITFIVLFCCFCLFCFVFHFIFFFFFFFVVVVIFLFTFTVKYWKQCAMYFCCTLCWVLRAACGFMVEPKTKQSFPPGKRLLNYICFALSQFFVAERH